MYHYTKSVTGKADVEKVWRLYEQVSAWHVWDGSVEQAALQGDFAQGASGTMKNQGMPPIDFTLTEVTPQTSFSNTSQIGPFRVTFHHHIERADDVVTVTHSVEVDGPDEQKVQDIGNGIAATIPSAIQQLLEQAQ